MIMKTNPFDDIAFDKQTKLLLDACVLISLLDETHTMYEKCNNSIEDIFKQNSKLYVSNVVISEVLNRTIYDTFSNDMLFMIEKAQPLNSFDNFNNILKCFSTNEQRILLTSDNRKDARSINFKRYFDHINKGKFKANRNVLKIYFEYAVTVVDTLLNKYDIQSLIINNNMMNIAKNLMCNYMIGVNDAQHIATALGHRMDYLLTCDGDFQFYSDDCKCQILKIK